MMTYRALLIGNSEFEADAGLNPLNAPTKDVARLHRALVDSATGLFADENVRLVIERSSHDLLDELDTFFSQADRDDLLLLYYSGHGLLDERNQLFLSGRNTRSDKLLRTAVSNVRINEFIEQSVARCTVIILDCCSSGMFKGGDVAAPLAGPGRYVVSSTRGPALANDAAVATGTSLFTEHLVTGLLGAADDRDGDGYLDLREVFDYVRTKLTATTKQIPHCRFDGDAAVMLAKRPAAPDPAGPAAIRAGDPTFVLSENMITLRDVGPDERLTPEVIEIYPLTDAEIDCTAVSDATWLDTEVRGARLTIELRPRPGQNRGKIVVRDRTSGTAQVVRVHVTLDPRHSPVTDDPPTADPSDPDPGGGRRKKRWLVAVAAAVLLITGTVGLLRRPELPPLEGTTPVPELVGLTRASAEAELRENGLRPIVVPASPGHACTPGAVIAQNPSAGQPADRGTQINIIVCGASSPATTPKTTGPTQTAKRVPVPRLGTTRRSAEAALRAVGLFARFEDRNSAEPQGQVIGSDPRRGVQVSGGSTIIVLVSRGNPSRGPQCRVPDVTGELGGIAQSLLSEAGLESLTRAVSSEQPAGTVVWQSRADGDEVGCGMTVTLSVSIGPEPTSTPPSTPPGEGG